MKKEMTSRERVVAAVNRQPVDRVPFDLSWGFTPGAMDRFRKETGHEEPYEYFNADTRFVGFKPTLRKNDYQSYHASLPSKARIDEWGVGMVPGSSHHFEHMVAPLEFAESPEEIDNFPMPDIMSQYRHWHLEKEVRDIQDRGLAAVGPPDTCCIFETAFAVRSLEELLIDLVIRPEMAERLLDRILEVRLEEVRRMVESGIDVLMLGDDIGTQKGMLFSPETWRIWFKPRLAKLISAARALRSDIPVFYHSDGDCSAVISDLIEVGVTILNPVQPECLNLSGLKQRYGDSLAFWGAVGVQTTLPFGTPEEVKRVVRERIEQFGKVGLVLGPTHVIEPEVPWENIVAFVKAVKGQ